MTLRILTVSLTLILLCGPAFGNIVASDETYSSFSLSSLIEPLGIATISFVCATFLTGLLRRRLGRIFPKLHLYLATISVILGLIHGTLVLVLLG